MADTELADEQQRHRERERETLLALFLLLLSDSHSHLRTQTELYLGGSLSVFAYSEAITGALLGSHTTATYLGRRLAGVRAPLGLQDQQFAQTVMAEQSVYVQGLVSDVQAGRYTQPEGEPDVSAALDQRLGLHARRLLGTANSAWALSQPPGTLVNWVLHPAEHCEDCISRAAGSPYDARSIPWVPGDGSSQCGVNDHCTLETVGGQRSFDLG